MRKYLYVVSLLVVLSVVLTACGSSSAPAPQKAEPTKETAKEEAKPTDTPTRKESTAVAKKEKAKNTIRVWCFTDELSTANIAYKAKHPDVEILFTQIPTDGGEYQTKLKAAFGTAEAPDVIALEAAFVRQYVESDWLADLGKLLPDAKEAETFQFVIDAGTHKGVTKAFSFQATPGGLFYRRSLAKEYFGTDDPKAIQELLSDFDKYTKAAEVVKQKSGGNTYMVASYADFRNPFLGLRTQPWILDNKLVVDPAVKKFVEVAKLFRDQGYDAQVNQWQEGWYAGMNDILVDAKGTPKKIFGYFLPT